MSLQIVALLIMVVSSILLGYWLLRPGQSKRWHQLASIPLDDIETNADLQNKNHAGGTE